MKIHTQTSLFFIRHAQTISNQQNIKQGTKIDDYLDTQGLVDVQKNLIPIVKLLDLDIIFTSYLLRAEETAAMLKQSLKTPIPILHDYRLRERNFGALSGKHITEIKKLIPDFDQRETFQTYDYRKFDGESSLEVQRRVVSAIYDIAQNQNMQNVGIITHGGVIRTVLYLFPQVVRIYHRGENPLKDIANCDIYEWEVHKKDLDELKSLIK